MSWLLYNARCVDGTRLLHPHPWKGSISLDCKTAHVCFIALWVRVDVSNGAQLLAPLWLGIIWVLSFLLYHILS